MICIVCLNGVLLNELKFNIFVITYAGMFGAGQLSKSDIWDKNMEMLVLSVDQHGKQFGCYVGPDLDPNCFPL